jgi:hypothetical protein
LREHTRVDALDDVEADVLVVTAGPLGDRGSSPTSR